MAKREIYLSHLDFENAIREILDFIKETVERANAKGMKIFEP